MLKKVFEEIDDFYLKCPGHIFEITTLKEELRKLLEKVSQVIWDAVAQAAHLQRELQLAQAEVSSLESIFFSREMRWEFVTRM